MSPSRTGRIAAVAPDISSKKRWAGTIAADGQLVLPGLVDFHSHVFHGFGYWEVKPEPDRGTYGSDDWNDAGNRSALTDAGLSAVTRSKVSMSGVTCFMNISSIGLVGENYEAAIVDLCDPGLFRRVADVNRDLIFGVKVRMGSPTVGATGVEPLRRAIRAGEDCGLPVMVHIATAPPGIDDVLELLRPGDILTTASPLNR